MPVGTSFENSAMKASFSLSSLQASETPEKCVKPRMYNSLTKNRKETKIWRRSWGSSASDQKDDFWSALQANYNYIMDNNLIDKCEEANGDLTIEATCTWSLNEFYSQFSELYSWLNSVQEAIYGREENITDKALRAHCRNTVLQKSSLWKHFNEQASQLVQLYPEVQEEVNWRVTHLNSKWDSILSILGPSDCGRCEQETCLDIDHEVKCLRKWIKNMETCLQPLDFHVKFTKTEIEMKALELMVLHRDIENHGKIVSSVVKLCKRTDASCNTANVRRVANGLERRWHLIFLRSLEWQCYIESLSKRDTYRNSTFSDSDCDGEPVSKYPRLSDKYRSNRNVSTSSSSSFEDEIFDQQCEEGMHRTDNSNGMITNETKLENQTKHNGEHIEGFYFPSVGEDTSHFTKSNRKAPNLATYYFKHEDTDSDMEKVEQLKQPTVEAQTTVDETSEDEWTYSKMDNEEKPEEKTTQESTCTRAATSKSLMQDIRRLVHEAEQLVSPDKNKKKALVAPPLNKITRVKEWLHMDKPDDSCDASGEDDERESQTSEDLDESVATCKAAQECGSQNTSFTELDTTDATPKVMFRQSKYTLKGHRPWSVSCISQLSQGTSNNGINKEEANLSISESALHHLAFSSDVLCNSANNVGVHGNSTSSTMEESGAVHLEEKASPARRKRLKCKKKAVLRKADVSSSCCTNVSVNSRQGVLMKSGSFSGCGNKAINVERHTSSDPSVLHFGQYGNYDTSTTSGADSEDDKSRRMTGFRMNSRGAYLNFDIRDSSPGKSSINAGEEQSSSLSEQAWDSYQEKYLSEAYSEAQDSDAARRLLEFGEDYRNFLDSQSDWSQSTNPEFSPSFKRKVLGTHNDVDSEDDDIENIRQLLQESREQLCYTKAVFKRQFAMGLNDYLVANDIGEMPATCDRHIKLLNLIEQSPEEFSLSKADRGETADLLQNWQNLKGQMLKMRTYRDLQKEILVLKNDLRRRKLPDSLDTLVITSIEDFSRDVDYHTAELTEIVDLKKKLLALNVAVHRFITENKDYNASSLKIDVSELYSIWNEFHSCANERVSRLSTLLQTWQMLENRLEQLEGDLREDEETLRLVGSALQGGTFSNQMAGVVRDVAKLLSETKNSQQDCLIPELFIEGGSLSDSGISDEGSEHELGERERRLAAIRRLVRQLEVAMAPDCKARLKMTEKLAAAERELRALQKRCRSLIVRTAVCAVAPPSEQPGSNAAAALDDPDNDPNPPSSTSSWFKRVMRASIPFHLAIVALLCVACLLEPHCCDNMNNFSMSFSPQLRYVRGPPPV